MMKTIGIMDLVYLVGMTLMILSLLLRLMLFLCTRERCVTAYTVVNPGTGKCRVERQFYTSVMERFGRIYLPGTTSDVQYCITGFGFPVVGRVSPVLSFKHPTVIVEGIGPVPEGSYVGDGAFLFCIEAMVKSSWSCVVESVKWGNLMEKQGIATCRIGNVLKGGK